MINADELREAIDSCDTVDVRDLFKESGLQFEIMAGLDGSPRESAIDLEMTFDLQRFKDALFRMLDRI